MRDSDDYPDLVIGAHDHPDPFYPFVPAASIRKIDAEVSATDEAILRSLGIEWRIGVAAKPQ